MADILPNSRPEKEQHFRQNDEIEHWLYVHELREMLAGLRPDDWVTPNEVYNLVIGRGNVGDIGVIDFFHNEVEFWDKGR